MKLESLSIRAPQSYDDFKGYQGTVTFNGDLGKVQIHTGDAMSRTILEVCAKELVAATQQVAHELTASIIEQVSPPALEAPAEEINT